MNGPEARGVSFRAQSEAIDTTTPADGLSFIVSARSDRSSALFFRERTRAGLDAAAARGRQGARKPVVTDEKLRRSQTLLDQGLTIREAAARIKVGKTGLCADSLKPAHTP